MKSDERASVNRLVPAVGVSRDELVAGDCGEPEPNLNEGLLERVLLRPNLQRALQQVRSNRGAPGIDGMSVDELPQYLREHWREIRARLVAGSYKPRPVRRVEIPKPDGRRRLLGIPQLQSDIRDGRRWVVDIDLESFFDRVNHDRLMNRLKRHVGDVRLLRLINRYLTAGVSVAGTIEVTRAGVPQGGPLSPVLANVVLDELDWELQRRGHRFARYADDCNIVVGSKAAGERVMASVRRFIEESLRLTVNARKSAVDRPWNRTFLGFTVTRNGIKLKVADKALDKLKDRVRELTRRTRGHRLADIVTELREALLGWKAYFGLTEVLSPLRDIDKWIRRKLRCYHWKQWGRRGYRELRRRGVSVREAWHTAKSAHGPWRLSQTPALALALPARYFEHIGLPCLAPRSDGIFIEPPCT